MSTEIAREKLRCPRLHPKQVEVVANALRGGKETTVTGTVGGWGSGKSEAAMVAFLLNCLRNPHVGRRTRPRSVIAAPTMDVLRDTAIHKFDAMCPDSLIISRRKAPWTVTLANGHQILAKSAEASMEGLDICTLLAEEIAHEAWWREAKRWPNFVARCRDPEARYRRVIVCGLPGANIRHVFEKPGIRLVHMAARDNPAVTEDVEAQIRAACPAGLDSALVGGDWIQTEGAVFAQYDGRTHLTDEDAGVGEVVHLAMDVGNHSHAVLFTSHPERGCLIFKEFAALGESIETLCGRILGSVGSILGPQSALCLDPTIRRDELSVLRTNFPTARIVQRRSSDPLYFREEGIRLTQWALKDASGKVRLRFHRRLEGLRGGVVWAMQNARRHPQTGTVVRDDVVDHAMDCVRYAVGYALGSKVAPTSLAR